MHITNKKDINWIFGVIVLMVISFFLGRDLLPVKVVVEKQVYIGEAEEKCEKLGEKMLYYANAMEEITGDGNIKLSYFKCVSPEKDLFETTK